MAKYKGFEILSMEDRSGGMSEGKLYWVTFKCYHKKQWTTKSMWVSGKNEADCRQKAIDWYSKD
jgi:hypothetical protein